MTVLENLEMGAYSQPDTTIKKNLEMVFERFPRLKERRRQIAGTLSGGEQQMLAMGRAMMSNPKILLLDEPSMGLSPILVDEIFDIIKTLNRDGTTILLVEQNSSKSIKNNRQRLCVGNRKNCQKCQGKELLDDDDVKRLI